MSAPEIGAVYRMPSGRFAFLSAVALDGCWSLDVVDPHRALVVDGQGLTVSPAMAEKLAVAWHAPQWASKVKDRVALNDRITRQQAAEDAERAERRAGWQRAQARLAALQGAPAEEPDTDTEEGDDDLQAD